MPGGDRLAKELEVGRDTIERALRRLEQEGVLANQGRRRPRLITLPDSRERAPLRIALLDYEPVAQTDGAALELLHRLEQAGHVASFTKKSLLELDMDAERVAREVDRTEADAWVVGSGSRDILTWFAAQPRPAFALFGRMHGLPIAGAKPDKIPAMESVTRQLLNYGHRRIVLLCRSERRVPAPGENEQAFLRTLAARGITVGPYNLPDWSESPAGFHSCLDSLFRHTPPTALIVDEAPFYFAAQQFLGGHRLRVPEDVSLACTDCDPAFAWAQPPVTHITYDLEPVRRRVVRWSDSVSRGNNDIVQTSIKADFAPGGTIGPARATR